MTEYAGSRDYVGTPHISTYPTEKQTPTLSQEFYLLSFKLFATRAEFMREGWSLFCQWDMLQFRVAQKKISVIDWN